jgi:hypothetical protein
MRRIRIIASIALASLMTCQSLIGQSTRGKKAQPRTGLDDKKKRPDLGVEYAQLAKFKLGTRKTEYHIGEMISIDLAAMNVSNAPVFLHKLNRPSLELKAQDAKGASVSIDEYHTVLEGVAPTSYQRVEPGHVLSGSFQLLAGCGDGNLKAYFQATERLQEEENRGGERAFFKGLFERDLFVNWGQACLAINKPGKYTITAQQSNDTVLVSPDRTKVKTAVGTIRSTSLTISIIE